MHKIHASNIISFVQQRYQQVLVVALISFALLLSGCSSSSNSPAYISRIYISDAQVLIKKFNSVQLTLAAEMSNGKVATDDLSELVTCSSSSALIDVTDDCMVAGLNAGDAEITLTLIAQSEIVPELEGIAVTVTPREVTELIVTYSTYRIQKDATQIFSLSAILNDDDVIPDARNIANCTPAGNAIVSVQDDCTVRGLALGSALVSAALIDSSAMTPTITSFSLDVIERAAIATPAPFVDNFIEHKFQTSLDTSYKVKLLSQSGTPLDKRIGLSLSPEPVFIASNKPCFNSPADDKSTVTCSIDTTGTTGEINVVLYNPPEGFSGTLELSIDDNVLTNDDQGKKRPQLKADYKLINTGVAPISGHVTSNIEGNNNSRYRTDVATGLLSTASGHQVKVVFQPAKDGQYYFDLDSVKVAWEFSDLLFVPLFNCTSTSCDCAIASADSIVCDVNNAQSELFVTVYGNGQDEIISSLTTVDGELAYTIEIINTP